jgi:hypothetical protein
VSDKLKVLYTVYHLLQSLLKSTDREKGGSNNEPNQRKPQMMMNYPINKTGEILLLSTYEYDFNNNWWGRM